MLLILTSFEPILIIFILIALIVIEAFIVKLLSLINLSMIAQFALKLLMFLTFIRLSKTNLQTYNPSEIKLLQPLLWYLILYSYLKIDYDKLTYFNDEHLTMLRNFIKIVQNYYARVLSPFFLLTLLSYSGKTQHMLILSVQYYENSINEKF